MPASAPQPQQPYYTSSPYYNPEARLSGLEERVSNLRNSMTSLETSTSNGFAAVQNQISALATEFRSARSTNWGTIAAWAAVVIMLGGALYYPVISAQTRMEKAQEELERLSMPRHEMQREWDRTTRILDRLEDRTNELWGLRDTINDVRRRIDRIENRAVP